MAPGGHKTETGSPFSKPKAGGYDPLDVHIGSRIRETRMARHLKQDDVVQRLGGIITVQQFRKYETGANRVSASMMFRIASILEVNPGHFFSGLVDPVSRQTLPEVSAQGHKLLRQLDGVDPSVADILAKLVAKVKRIGSKT